ncbi:hypothetical protein OESDEN_10601 [Oesophagostomum dentatum]|uniref:Uncharacterized protein n=1 Tax=Oesophagostomum dentatum TaxID=61180 RepID=A0A0B1T2G4_OESDE|nr:hypothetical protein OESDEN_10601 [Oesophagostomum dentatum]
MFLGPSRLYRCIIAPRQISVRLNASHEKAAQPDKAPPPINPRLRRGPDERDITTMDIIEERIRNRAAVRVATFGGQKQSWNYRSEIVGKLGLDNKHRYVWVAYAIIIVFGFSAFVYVKSNVVLSRKEEMEQRERIRRELKLMGADRKKLGVVDSQ